MTTHWSQHITVARADLVNAQVAAIMNDPDGEYWAEQFHKARAAFEDALTEAQFERWLYWLDSNASFRERTFKDLAGMYLELHQALNDGAAVDYLAYLADLLPECPGDDTSWACPRCAAIADFIALQKRERAK